MVIEEPKNKIAFSEISKMGNIVLQNIRTRRLELFIRNSYKSQNAGWSKDNVGCEAIQGEKRSKIVADNRRAK